jgi:hypothetical protein
MKKSTKPDLRQYNTTAYKRILAEKKLLAEMEGTEAYKQVASYKRNQEIEALEEKLGFDDAKTRIEEPIMHTYSTNAFSRAGVK